MHFTVYGTLLSQGPLTAFCNFDSGSAFYNLIVGPHRVTLYLYGLISDFFKGALCIRQSSSEKITGHCLLASFLTIQVSLSELKTILWVFIQSSLLGCLSPHTVVYFNTE